MSLGYVTGTLEVLHPEARIGSAVGEESLRYVLVPNATRPALVLPAGSRAQAAAACRRYAQPQGFRARARTGILAGVFASGLGSLAFRDQLLVGSSPVAGLDQKLSDLLNTEVALAFPVGKVRSNRKPVVQAIDQRGAVLAFVKLGVDELTDSLVAHEATTLERLNSLDRGIVRIPRLLASGDWLGHRFLVTEALPAVARRSPDSGPTVVRAMRDVAVVDGVIRGPFAELPWWGEVMRSVEALPSSSTASRIQRVCAELATLGQTSVAGGAWHGDWNHGNFAVQGANVLVWDWERFRLGVPLGWDALHLAVRGIVPRGGAPTPQRLVELMEGVRSLVQPLGAEPGTERLVGTLYLLELGTRMLADRQAELGVALGDIDAWLLPVLEQLTQSLVTDSGITSPLRTTGADS